ncbi:MAG: glycosyltransferase, partial [Lachnospiraceae bacterium]|nr:glycosyltransferase [Lachnospiraceae bacterium]
MNSANIIKTIDYARRNGLTATIAAVRERLTDERQSYVYEAPTAEELDRQRTEMRQAVCAGKAPRISVVVPCHQTPPAYLAEMRASVEGQSYENFELILSEEPGGISENTNAGIARATGEYIGLLDHDDLLAPDALYHVARAILEAREKGVRPILVYTDEDKLTEESPGGGQHFFAPNRKPDYNYDYLLSNNYICHFAVIEAETLKRLKLRSEYDGAQDHDLFLRLTADTEKRGWKPEEVFLHVPRVLYHWRSHAASTAESGANKSWAHVAGKRAVMAHLSDRGIHAAVEEMPHRGFLRVHYFDDLFAARPDLGAIGGKLTDRRGRMVGGLYTDDGEILFDGLPAGYSGGFTHRAACAQDAEAVDLADVTIRPELLRELSQDPGLE